MEATCSSLRSPALTTVHPSVWRSGFFEKILLHGQTLKLSKKKTYPLAGRLKFLHVRAEASSTKNVSSEVAEAISKKEDLKDGDLVFVAGATGRVGSRTVRELLKLGFRVRAGVRSSQRAEVLIESVKQMKLDGDSASEKSQPVEKLEIVKCDLEKPDQIEPAIGNAAVVICCIGASEKEIFDVTGPYRIDYVATKNLIEAATVAKVKHFILLTSLGTNKIGFPAAILNLFWGVLVWKRKAEEALIGSGLPYTIVRPGGMERPTDAYKETHNTTLSPEDTLFGGQVSNLQVAELMACIAKNPGLSFYKVVEVIAETTAPLTPLEDLLTTIPFKVANAFPKKEYGAARILDPPPSESVTSGQLSIGNEKESAEANVTKQSSSPYIVYDDLKPPTSPTLSAPVGPTDLNVVDGVSNSISDAQTTSAGVSTENAEAKPAHEKTMTPKPLSPYVVYEDLKPPTSPSPSAPSLSSPASVVNGPPQPATSTVNSMSQVPEADNSKSETHHAEPKKQPLSPFTMYEDLKPPSSPTPSPGKS